MTSNQPYNEHFIWFHRRILSVERLNGEALFCIIIEMINLANNFNYCK